jgi:hypothetical protein
MEKLAFVDSSLEKDSIDIPETGDVPLILSRGHPMAVFGDTKDQTSAS